MVYYTVDTVDTAYTVYTIETPLHCLNSCTYAGCPKKVTNRMLLGPWCTSPINTAWHHLGLENVFWSSLTKTKTKQDQAPPSHVHGKI